MIRESKMYRTLSLTPLGGYRNSPDEEGKEEDGRRIGREADSFSVGKQQQTKSRGEIPNRYAA